MSGLLAAVGLATGCLGGWFATGAVGDWRQRLPLAAGAAYVALGLAGVLLAQQGWLFPESFAATGVLVLAAGWVSRVSAKERASGLGVAIVAAVLLGVLVFFAGSPVMDVRLEASDPGVYAATAARIDRTGGIAFHDPLIVDLRPQVRERLFPEALLSPARSPGFYLEDRDRGRVVPQFLPLAPVWLVVARWLVGAAGASWAAVAAIWLAALAIFGLLWRVSGPVAAVVGAFLLATNFVGLWFARLSAAEPFALALIVISVSAYVESRRRDVAAFGWLAGAAIGACWLAKLELLLLGLPLAGLFALDTVDGSLRRSATRAYWLAVAASGALFFIHAWGWARPYVRDVLLVPGVSLATVTFGASGAAAIALVLYLLARRRGFERWARLPDCLPDGVVIGLLVLVALGLAHGLLVRPLGNDWNDHNVPMLAWMLTPAGLALATIGLARALWKRSGEGFTRMVILLLAVTSLLVWRKEIQPHLLWAFRRYLPLVLPFGVAMIGVAVGWWASGFRTLFRGDDESEGAGPSRRLVPRLAVVALLAPLVGMTLFGSWRSNRVYAAFEDLAGTQEVISRLDRLLPSDAFVLIERRTRRGLLRFENVLQHELGLGVWRMRSHEIGDDPDREVLLTQWRRDRPTYLLTSGNVIVPFDIGVRPVAQIEFLSSQLDSALRTLPTTASPMNIRARLYELSPETVREPLQGRLDVGAWDDRYLDGPTFHEVEYEPDRDYRWTHETGALRLPDLAPTDELMLLRLASAYPPERGTQEVVVRLDGRELASFPVRRGWRDYEVPLEGAVDGSIDVHRLELQAIPPLDAAGLTGSGDSRTVGVAVDLVRWGARPR